MRCKNCGSELAEGGLFCETCGCRVEESQPCFCPNCGEMNDESDALFCGFCGADLQRTEEIGGRPKRKKKILILVCVGALILLLAGGFGVYSLWNNIFNNDSIQEDDDEDEENRNKKDRNTDKKEEVKEENEFEKEDAVVEEKAEEKEVSEEEESENEKQTTTDKTDSQPDALNALDVEQEVLRIREIYNEIQQNTGNYSKETLQTSTCYTSPDYRYKKYVVSKNVNGINYEQWYFCEDDQLIFSFYFSGQTEERFYFYQGQMFRWIDSNKTIRDKDVTNPDWIEWENIVLNAWRGL